MISILLTLSLAIQRPIRIDEPPSVVVILLDDVGHDLLAAANTPTIDSIATNGVIFTQAWSMPVCSPTRASLLTGRFPFRHGIGTIIAAGDDPSDDLSLNEIMLPEALPFATAALGKWHLGHSFTHPNDCGFNYFAGNLFNMAGDDNDGYYNWHKVTQGIETSTTVYSTLDTTNEAIFSDRLRFRYVAYNACHKPWNNKGKPPGYNVNNGYETALAQLEYADSEIARLLTNYDGYVFILGDNGTPQTFGGGKSTLSESGIGVPFIVAGPGIQPAVVDDLINVTDIFATICAIHSVQVPAGAADDSISLMPILNGGTGTRVINFSETFPVNHDLSNRSVAIRNASYKLIETPVSEVLYSMPGEVEIQPPYTGQDLVAYNILIALLHSDYQW